MVDEYKSIFLGKRHKPWNSSEKISRYIEVTFKFVFKCTKSRNRIFWKIEYWFKALESQTWSMNTKLFFWESEAKPQTLQKFSPYIGVSFKFVLNSVKRLNRIFWAVEYWSKTLQCQIWLTNTKAFSWESETNLGTLQKISPYIGVTYKFVLKCAKNRNRIFWKTEYWFKALEGQIWSMNTKPFFWESKAKLKTLQKLSPYIGVSLNSLLSLSKP